MQIRLCRPLNLASSALGDRRAKRRWSVRLYVVAEMKLAVWSNSVVYRHHSALFSFDGRSLNLCKYTCISVPIRAPERSILCPMCLPAPVP